MSEEEIVSQPQQVEPAPLVWPEDLTILPQAQEAFEQLVKELNMPTAQAQKLVDLETQFARLHVQNEQQEKQQQLEKWAEETKQFFGANWEKEVAAAVAAADLFGGPELRKLLEETGLGNHPVIVRTFNGIGKRISEDNTPGGNMAVLTDKTFTEALYGNINKGE